MIQTAVILAAGMGTRLQGEIADHPKGFLRLGTLPIIEESIRSLMSAGIEDIVIVTGHRAAYYDALSLAYGGRVRTVGNPVYAESGSMYSLYCARDAVDKAFLLLESDLIYEPRALTELLAHPAEDAILLSGPTGAGDEVFVATNDGILFAMSKDADSLVSGQDESAGIRVTGELVGISKISAELFALMLRIAAPAFEKSLFFDYETDCLVAAARERPIACPVVPDLVWSEIDDPTHLQRARDVIYPEIRRRTK